MKKEIQELKELQELKERMELLEKEIAILKLQTPTPVHHHYHNIKVQSIPLTLNPINQWPSTSY